MGVEAKVAVGRWGGSSAGRNGRGLFWFRTLTPVTSYLPCDDLTSCLEIEGTSNRMRPLLMWGL